jgi:hypothetical protein
MNSESIQECSNAKGEIPASARPGQTRTARVSLRDLPVAFAQSEGWSLALRFLDVCPSTTHEPVPA